MTPDASLTKKTKKKTKINRPFSLFYHNQIHPNYKRDGKAIRNPNQRYILLNDPKKTPKIYDLLQKDKNT